MKLEKNQRQLRTIELLKEGLSQSYSKDFVIWLKLLRDAQEKFNSVNREREKAISRMTREQVEKAMRSNQVEIARLHARTYALKVRLMELQMSTPTSSAPIKTSHRLPELSIGSATPPPPTQSAPSPPC